LSSIQDRASEKVKKILHAYTVPFLYNQSGSHMILQFLFCTRANKRGGHFEIVSDPARTNTKWRNRFHREYFVLELKFNIIMT
jgi:hypothetical protein